MMELVSGGSGSGKSAYAEDLICAVYRSICTSVEDSRRRPSLYYIASMGHYGEETEEKIAAHRKQRDGKGFHTLEWYTGLTEHLSGPDCPVTEGSCVLLECISNLTANEMYMEEGAGKNTVEAITNGIRLLKERCAYVVVVTNDVFAESVMDSKEMKEYKRVLGQINRNLAQMADRVTRIVYGVRCPVSGTEEDSDDPEEQGNTEKNKKTSLKIVTGGAFQGKKRYADTIFPGRIWTDGSTCPLDEIRMCTAIEHFHLFIRRWMKEGRTKEELMDAIEENGRDIIIVCDEIGCGLVPTDAFERSYRETTGRIMSELAGRAERVDQVVCGIGRRIK